jgi:glutamate--cysteine ligase
VIDVARHVDEHVFGTPRDQAVGIELEWLTLLRGTRDRPSLEHLDELLAAAQPVLPRGGLLTMEPGGQLELSTRPYADAEQACEAAGTDLFHLEQLADSRGIELIALGSDPVRQPERITTAGRYRAMERFFARDNPDGQRMMCNTASIQLNIGLGADDEALRRRWRLANHLSPTLIAAFANSPLEQGLDTGWQSSRLKTWWAIDPTRTSPVDLDLDPREAWLAYALDANVMLTRVGDHYEPLDRPLAFGAWLEQGHDRGWPTIDDFSYHLTTLFPPIRPRGWLELRVFDALPTPFWHVAAALTTTLLDDPALAPAVASAVRGTEHLWVEASRSGLTHPALAASARAVFEIALRQLNDSDPDGVTEAIVRIYYERWIEHGRSPASDQLDTWRRTGRLLPAAESPIRYVDFEQVIT